jgi:ankyrin repeat protein
MQEGHTPFFFAAWENHVEIVNYLLINDHVYVNVTDANGYNALHVACSTKNVKLTQVCMSITIMRCKWSSDY